VAKVKVIKTNLDGNLNGNYFNDTPSNTVFSFGRFFVTSNFDNKVTIDYTDSLSSFVRPVTLDTLNVNDTQSEIIQTYTTNAVLNLDKSDLNTFVRYGSAYEFLRTSIQNIILAYPGSLFANSQKDVGGNQTYQAYSYDSVSNISTFLVPTGSTVNTFGLVFNDGNDSIPDDNELKNLNISYEDYVIWSSLESDTLFKVVGYTGNTVNSSDPLKKNFLRLQVEGNPFEQMGTGATGRLDYHIRPNNVRFEEFRALLENFEKNIVSKRDGTNGFVFTLKDPTQLEDGTIIYSDSQVVWSTGDKYNVDVSTPKYQKFLEVVLSIGAKYDTIKTDLIARFLTPASLKSYDFTEDGKMTKLLRIYGREFDQIRQFIDSLVNINKVTYDKLNNLPDQIVKNMANTFGWDYFSLVNEQELVEGFLTVDDTERDLNEDILPAEIDVELWRRILNNTSYFWKSKGTREAIKSMFLLIGIPEPFINITEYVYTVDGKIDPNTVTLAQGDFPSNSLPYDTEGYPVAPLETSDFYFQVSGDTDSGQAYLDVFRDAGFNLKQTPDNKKSWVEAGAVTRSHYTTSQYYQEDSKLVINTKEVDIALDTARGIEYDVFKYIQTDYTANSSGYTLPYSYVNISLGVGVSQQTFPLPDKTEGDFEVRYNGILLNAPKTGTTTGITTGATGQSDYTIDYSANTFTITNPAINSGNRKDVIQATYVYSGGTAITGISVQYVVTRVNAILSGTYIPLPSFPRGDLQLTINGIALTKGTSQFVADYILDPANSSGGTNNIIIQNPEVISYLAVNPNVQVAYIEVTGSTDINMRSEVVRVDSFNSSKIYFNNGANKYVYKLNYKVNDAKEVKFLIDGIALEPYTDYSINVQNPYEVFLPKGIRYGTVISAYYLVANSGAFSPVIEDIFGIGDISELSFLEFLELMQRKMISSRNRKVVTDFKGGWYPTLLRIYETYLKRGLLGDDNPLQSNGYTFQNLYPFLSKYNAFFQRFVDQLLSATIIIKRGGLLIRNSVFTKQKHWYKRGVNVSIDAITHITGTSAGYLDRVINKASLQYFGDDGSKFSVLQEILAPPPPPTPLYVETTPGVLGSLTTGGRNIIGFDEVNEYGVDYKLTYPYPYASAGTIPIGLENLLEGVDFETEVLAENWTRISQSIPPTYPLAANHFSMTLTGLDEGTWYDYRAFIESPSTGATGNTRSIETDPAPPPSYEVTTVPVYSSSVGTTGIYETGGINIVGGNQIDYYGMQYRVQGYPSWSIYGDAFGSLYNGSIAGTSWQQDIEGLTSDTTYEIRAYMQIHGLNYYGNIVTETTDAIPLVAPLVRNVNVSGETYTTAKITGDILGDGNPDYTVKGFVWNTSPNPTVALSTKTASGFTGTGEFTHTICSLSQNTTYYVSTYATNTVDTCYPPVFYGRDMTFATPSNEITVSMGSRADLSPGLPEDDVRCCAKITLSHGMTSGDRFKLYFTNCASLRIYKLQPWSISSCAKASVGGSDCCKARNSGEIDPGAYTQTCSGFICVTSSTSLSTIPFIVSADSHAGNDVSKFLNEGYAKFTSICNNVENTKTYVLTPTSTLRCICARNQT